MNKRRKTSKTRKMLTVALAALMLALAACSGNNTPENTPAPTVSASTTEPTAAVTAEPTDGANETEVPETDKPTEAPSAKPTANPNGTIDFSDIPENNFIKANSRFVNIDVSKFSSSDFGIGSCSYQLPQINWTQSGIYKALERLGVEIRVRAITTYGELVRDRDPEEEVHYIQKLYLRRADRGYVSILFETRTGGEHPEYSCVNLVGSSGKSVALSDIVPDLAELAALINERLNGFTVTEAYLADFAVWTLDRDGLYFVFNSGEYGGFTLAEPTALLIPFSSLGLEEALKPRTENGSMELPLDLPAYCVENGEVVELSFSTERIGDDWDWHYELNLAYGEKTCGWLYDRAEDAVNWLDGRELNLVYANGKRYLYAFDTGTGGYVQLVVVELSDQGELELIDGGAWYNDGTIVDTSRIMLGKHTDVLSHVYSGNRAFEVGEDGIPVPLANYYDIKEDGRSIDLYALKPFEAIEVSLEDGSLIGSITVPAGTELNYEQTTDFLGEEDAGIWQAYCVMHYIDENASDSHKVIVRVDATHYEEYGAFQFTVNGTDIFDLFGGMDFYRSPFEFCRPASSEHGI